MSNSSCLIITVSRLNKIVRKLLEEKLHHVNMIGEISNFSQPASGHWYFTLKDDCAEVRCAMFRNSNRSTMFTPRNGQQIIVHASITLYESRGYYQLIAGSMKLAGNGLIQQKFERLKQQLSIEGLFNSKFKKSLPSPARCVGVITSVSGAALHDILQVLQRRDPLLPVVIYPTAVQGQESPDQIVRTIKLANTRSECDVLILGRGGGSLEDLDSFNDEKVAREIFNSRLPIVSAVGHDINITIADLIADLRASTPSSAAELVSRNKLELLRQLQSQYQKLKITIDYFITHRKQCYNHLYHCLQQQHPQLKISYHHTILISLYRRMEDDLRKKSLQAMRYHEYFSQNLLKHAPIMDIDKTQQSLQTLLHQLIHVITQQVNNNKNDFIALCSRMDGINPLKTLVRGFSVTTDIYDTVIKEIYQVKIGDCIITRIKDGWIKSRIINIKINN